MASAPLVLVDVASDSGVVGHAYVCTYAPSVLPAMTKLLEDISGQLVGEPVAPKTVMAEFEAVSFCSAPQA